MYAQFLFSQKRWRCSFSGTEVKAAAVGRYENSIQSVLSLWGFWWHLFFIMCSVLTQGQWHPEHFTYSFCVGLLWNPFKLGKLSWAADCEVLVYNSRKIWSSLDLSSSLSLSSLFGWLISNNFKDMFKISLESVPKVSYTAFFIIFFGYEIQFIIVVPCYILNQSNRKRSSTRDQM